MGIEVARLQTHIGDLVELTGSGHQAGSGDVRGRIVKIHETTAGAFARVHWHHGIETVIPMTVLASTRKGSGFEGES